jgi:DNA-binding transcriptional ArsR family regulator
MYLFDTGVTGLQFSSENTIFNHMVNNQHQYLDAVFHALSDPTRRGMLAHLAEREDTVSNLAAPYKMSLAAASKHIRVLERADLIQRTVHGRTHICRLKPASLAKATVWLRFYERFWAQRLDALELELLKK